ncbi:DUF1472 domain-containing protein [Pectobacterium carotovorum subsp. carotovorum]|nr:DUF1472 domain-containing protein [Pectobacterium carotovorum subsp. carotovorum]MCL6349566.1 DUF1472 domain-containing protein [Pectobacterium carotovorum subsp. carotovorum]QXE13123.1 DUF1472 domain-containing protein [Pectobacterium atrosepticum]
MLRRLTPCLDYSRAAAKSMQCKASASPVLARSLRYFPVVRPLNFRVLTL